MIIEAKFTRFTPDLKYTFCSQSGENMKRRDFIKVVGGVVGWSLAARAQQPDRMRRIGVLMAIAAEDPESKARLAAFTQGFQQLGWIAGQNVQIDYRSTAGNAEICVNMLENWSRSLQT